MGLESINFIFRSGEKIKDIIESNTQTNCVGDSEYVIKEQGQYWIDIQLQDVHSLSIRITLCNPENAVLPALDKLLSFLFSFRDALVYNQHSKEKYYVYDDDVKEKIVEAYVARKKVFASMYGNYTAAIGSEEFYKIQIEKNGWQPL